MKNEEYYKRIFEPYPDVVTFTEFKEMLGGIANSTARKLLRENHVKHFYVRTTYRIPKVWVIEYVLSEHYAEYRQKLKVQV
ncbi:MAG: DNA-binding protein [Clostridia bacterium]|nr:DNA-binding protein [Clostridia bacterium]